MLKLVFVKLCIKTLDHCDTQCSEVFVTECLNLCLTYISFVNVSTDKWKSTHVGLHVTKVAPRFRFYKKRPSESTTDFKS